MATVVCARCGLEFEVVRTGRTEPRTRMDLPSFMLRCVHRKDATLRADDPNCPELDAAIFCPAERVGLRSTMSRSAVRVRVPSPLLTLVNSSVITVARLSMAVAMAIAWRNSISRSIL